MDLCRLADRLPSPNKWPLLRQNSDLVVITSPESKVRLILPEEILAHKGWAPVNLSKVQKKASGQEHTPPTACVTVRTPTGPADFLAWAAMHGRAGVDHCSGESDLFRSARVTRRLF